jgi:hypothetical protein
MANTRLNRYYNGTSILFSSKQNRNHTPHRSSEYNPKPSKDYRTQLNRERSPSPKSSLRNLLNRD